MSAFVWVVGREIGVVVLSHAPRLGHGIGRSGDSPPFNLKQLDPHSL